MCLILFLTHKMPITNAADDKFVTTFFILGDK